mmetsp:Transcript_108214/g.271304  ORF Transcript_108214/g.271304 Transcript_108214/m.271304 type:complete len:224 (-) Transcript_108214:2034-2705(-)
MKVGSTTSTKSWGFARIKAPSISHKLKRTDCALTGGSSSGSTSSPSESSSTTGPPRRRSKPGSLGVSAGQGMPSRSCAITTAMSFTPSLVSTPSPALRRTPAQPAAWIRKVVQVDSVSSSLLGEDIMAPTVLFKNSATSSRNTAASRQPLPAAPRAHPAKTSQVLKTVSRRLSESCISKSGSKFWHVAGRKWQKSSSNAKTKEFVNSKASSISSSTEVFKPSN